MKLVSLKPGWLVAMALAVGAALPASGQTPVLIKETFSREFSVHVNPDTDEVVSREYSLRVEQAPLDELQGELLSREFSLIVADTEDPPVITEMVVTPSPTGDSVVLDWSGYNQWAVGDITRFDIYFSDAGGFTDVTGMTPYISLPVESTTVTLDGLAEFTDHFFAIIAVDALGNFNPLVEYSAAYIITPEIVSREFSFFNGQEASPAEAEVVSREYAVVVSDAEPPPVIDDLAVSVSPEGDEAVLDWTSYNQWLVGDIARFDVFLSDTGPIFDVTGLTPHTAVPVETTSLALSGLAPGIDHFFAVVPVDGLGNFEPLVRYSAGYVLSPEVMSREFSFFVGEASVPPMREVVSREFDILVPDDTVPEPVTGLDSGFTVATSVTAFQGLDLSWPNYNERAQVDVMRYRVYVGTQFFDDVSGMEPYAMAPAGASAFTVEGLESGGIFHVAVVAEDALGNFDPVVRSTSGQASVGGVEEVANLEVETAGESLRFTWDLPEEGGAFLDGYRVYFSGEDVRAFSAAVREFEVFGLERGRSYPFRVTTVDIFRNESGGRSIFGTTWFDNPAGVVADGLDERVELNWDSVGNVALLDHYAVYQSGAEITDVTGMSPVATSTGTNVVVGGLVNGATQHFAVVAVNVSGGFDPAVVSVEATPVEDVDGPRVLAAVPSGVVVGELASWEVEFSEKVRASTFGVEDVLLGGQEGAFPAYGVERVDDTHFRIDFGTKVLEGDYVLRLGPEVEDMEGNAMNQDEDAVNGEPFVAAGDAGDAFVGTVSLSNGAGPLVDGFVPSGPVNVPVSSVVVRFSDPVDPGTVAGQFSVEDSGGAPVAVTGEVVSADGREVTVSFAEQGADGVYRVLVGSGVRDVFGDTVQNWQLNHTDGFTGDELHGVWASGVFGATPGGVRAATGFVAPGGGGRIELASVLPEGLGDLDVRFGFDLYVIGDGWDGDGMVLEASGVRVWETSFSNLDGSVQAYPDGIAAGTEHPAGTGATERDGLGFGTDALYRRRAGDREIGFVHPGGDLGLRLEAAQDADLGAETWPFGLDEVRVRWRAQTDPAEAVEGRFTIDRTAPEVESMSLAGMTVSGLVNEFSLQFSEPVDPASVGDAIEVTAPGGASVTVLTMDIVVEDSGHMVVPMAPSIEAPGIYSVSVEGVRDLAGNASVPYVGTFVVEQADLRVTTVAGPALPVYLGRPFHVSWTVQNVGQADYDGRWTDRVWLVDGAGTKVRSLGTLGFDGLLEAGGSLPRELEVTVPEGQGPGSYRLAVGRSGETAFQLPAGSEATSVDPVLLELESFPVIDSFTLGGVDVADDLAVTESGLLAATASDGDGIVGASFWYQVAGAATATLIGEDTDPGDGFEAFWPLGSLGNGVVDLIVRAADGRGSVGELRRTVRVVLGVPAAPEIAAPVDGTVTRLFRIDVSGTAAAEAFLLIDRNGTRVFEGLPERNGTFSVEVPLLPGENAIVARSRNLAGTSADAGPVVVTQRVEFPDLVVEMDGDGTLVEGETASGVVRVAEALPGGLAFTVSTTRPSRVSTEQVVAIPPGGTEGSFVLRGLDDSVIGPALDLLVRASAPGFDTGEAPVRLLDDDWPTLSMVVSSDSVGEGDGEQAAFLTVTRDPVGVVPLVVALGSSDETAAVVPAEALIPAGAASVTVPVAAVDDDVADGPQVAELVAAAILEDGSSVADAGPLAVTVLDDESAALRLLFSRPTVFEGRGVPLRVMRAGGDASGALEVFLQSGDEDRLGVPASAVIADGEREVTVVASALPVVGDAGTESVTVTAVADGFDQVGAAITVTDAPQADLVVFGLEAPAEVHTDQYFRVRYTVENSGGANAPGPFLQRLSLSDDPVPGDDVLLSQYNFEGSELAGGLFFTREEQVRAPTAGGRYWLIAETDAGEVVDEISEANNVVVSVAPVDILAAYTAEVSVAEEFFTANEPVPMSGTARRTTDDQPAGHVLVSIDIVMGETRRRIAALTNAAGQFSTTWTPLSGEGGNYQVGAGHPGVGELLMQDAFSIQTVRAELPERARVLQGEAIVQEVVLSNPTELVVGGLGVGAIDVPAGLTVTPVAGADGLGAGESTPVAVTISAAADAEPGLKAFSLRVTSAEGLEIDFPMSVIVEPLLPLLVVEPGEIYKGVVRPPDADTPVRPAVVQFLVKNTGTASTGALTVSLPDLPWVKLAAPSPLPALDAGEERVVTLLLSPGAEVPLTEFRGNLVLAPEVGVSIGVPFRFRVVSDLEGDLAIDVVDEFYFFTAEKPKVEGATVVLRDVFSGAVLEEAVTGAEGSVLFESLREGPYRVEVSSPLHTSFEGNFFVEAETTVTEQVFLPRNLVTYNWTVEEVAVQDRYRIEVESVFETNVPAPVVTVTPAVIDVEDLVLVGQTKVVNLTVENHGLINSEQGRFEFGSHPYYEITPLVEDVGTLPAKSSITVPVTIRRTAVPAAAPVLAGGDKKGKGGAAKAGGVPCSIPACYCHGYVCGKEVVARSEGIAVSGVQGNCGGGGGAPWYPVGGGGPGAYASPVAVVSKPSGCVDDCVFDVMFDIIKKLLPLPDWAGCAESAANAAASGKGWGKAALDCGCFAVGSFVPVVKAGCDAAGYIECLIKIAECLEKQSAGGGGGGNGASPLLARSSVAPFGGTPSWLFGEDALAGANEIDGELEPVLLGMNEFIEFRVYIAGSQAAALVLVSDDAAEWNTALMGAIWEDGPGGALITAAEKAALLVRAVAEGVDVEVVEPMIDRWAFTAEQNAAGNVDFEDVAEEDRGRFIADDVLRDKAERLLAALAMSRSDGFASPFEQFYAKADEIAEARAQGGGGVCARVRLRIEQEAVMTRSAFRATLDLANNVGDSPLTGVGFEFDIRDADGNPANDRFGIRVARLDGLGAVDGTGLLTGGTSGVVQWEIIPNEDAAPLEATTYTFGGTIRYTQAGTDFAIPVSSPPLTVRPDAALYLDYFHQRSVYSDDPHTDPIEPSVPYNLALMVENRGAGAARNLQITSAQPEIVENEKGLFIDFQITGTEVAGQPLSPTLTAEFGDLAPGETKVGRWLMTSTLQGLFIDYSATFEHLDGLGDERLSLIKEVNIHEMIQLFEALGDKADGLPDFLVNDVADVNDYPDTVYLSDGTTAPVLVQESAKVNGELSGENLQVVLDGVTGGGWTYLRIPDPGDGAYQLVGVERSDGLALPVGSNAWVTDRTFIGLGRRPVYENILHLLDCGSTGSYTLTYVEAPEPDLLAPSSQVVALEPNSEFEIPVSWGGADDRGVAYYDVFVSVDGGPWEVWLAQTRLTSAIFQGELGTNYSFYSVATDFAGNREDDPGTADATTLVSLQNVAPVLEAIADQSVAEGGVFELTAVGSDTDGPASALRYSVESEAPGLVIDELTGAMRWVTGEADGGRSFPVTVRVTDGGSPRGVGSEVFALTVVEDNRAPVVAPVERQVVPAGGVMIVDVDATDTDVPAQTVSFRLGASAPAGMAIDPETGLLGWSPPRELVGQDLVVEVIVEDDGAPSAATTVGVAVAVVEPPDSPPQFDTLPVVLWLAGQSYSATVTASDPDGDPVTLAADLAGLLGTPGFESTAGDGEFSWETTGVASGVYRIPVTATARGVDTEGTIAVRIAEGSLYWNWAAERVVGVPRVEDFEMEGDPDRDGRRNVFELALRVDPMVADDAPVVAGQVVGAATAVTRFEFLRLTGTGELVDIFPIVSTDLGVGDLWGEVPEGERLILIDPDGDDDGDPTTERVVIEVFWFGDSEVGSGDGRRFFKLDGRVR